MGIKVSVIDGCIIKLNLMLSRRWVSKPNLLMLTLIETGAGGDEQNRGIDLVVVWWSCSWNCS